MKKTTFVFFTKRRWVELGKEPTVKVGDTWVFTGERTMEQMQALKETIESVSQRLALCYVLTAISVLLSLVALVSAVM